MGGIGQRLAHKGLTVVNVELKLGWDFLDDIVMSWLIHVCLSGYCRFLLLETPCTTCSLARKPALRSTALPCGLDLDCERMNAGSYFAVACLALALVQMFVGDFYLLEQPACGYMRWFPS